ncbi:2398_t:CDS:2 [Ambispora gerdemannii]|uniref:2398_t:CDS:1 n=1 Tax=Ambispora gerdemannii TaxID=144530 RepID=A0A9N9AG26_9GLOM|nr:2398_t:CDS:2 [Ambispora gerdemannii]
MSILSPIPLGKNSQPTKLSILLQEKLHSCNESYFELSGLHRDRRPRSTREEMLLAMKEKERKEFKDGIEIPDLMNPRNVRALREWNGDLSSLSRIIMFRVEEFEFKS